MSWPKGENATITAARRGIGSQHCKGLGQSVQVLDPFWDESARSMVKGLILHVLTAPEYQGRRNLVTVRKLILRGGVPGRGQDLQGLGLDRGGTMGHGSIEYSMTDEPRGSMNEAVSVKADDQTLYFEALGMQSYGHEKEKLTFQGAAEMFWELFIRPLQS